MTANKTKWIGSIAVLAILIVGIALYQIKSIYRDAEREEQLTQIRADVSVSDRFLGRAQPFSVLDVQGVPFASEELAGRTWIGQTFESTGTEAHARFASLMESFVPLDDELARPVWFVSLTQSQTRNASDCVRWKQLSGDASNWTTQNGSETKRLADPSSCVLVDSNMRVRGVYDTSNEMELERLKNDALIVSAEMTPQPADLMNPDWLAERAEQQLATKNQLRVPADFQFRDRQSESGIRFQNKVVDQAARGYRAAHYDHGTGVVVADVDGDQLLDIYFVKQAGTNQLYRNLGGGKFEDITAAAGVAVADRVCVTASFGDIDNDGDPDLFVTSVRGGNVMFRNDGDGKFTDITETAGLEYVGHSSSAVLFDFDHDGLLDIFLTNVGKYTTDEKRTVTTESIHDVESTNIEFYTVVDDAFGGHLMQDERGESSILYRNLGGHRFEDVSEKMNLVDDAWTGDAIPVDFNQDGWQDLYLPNMQGPDQYYVNREGKSFEKRTEAAFPKTPWGAMGIQSFDFENDGDMDLFITDMHSDMSQKVDWTREKEKADIQWPESFTQTGGNSVWGNAFFRNDGDESFVEISDQINAENYWPWGLSTGDINADGYEDVFITASMNYPFRYAVNSLLLNNRGETFIDSEFILGVEPRRGGQIAEPMFEVTSSEAPEHPTLDGRLGRASVWSALGSRSSVIFDLDQDGDLDIVTNEFNSVPMVLVSDLAAKETPLHYVKIKLVGTKSNRDGLGAMVSVKTASQTLTKIHDGQSGYMSQSSYPLYFGLGDQSAISEIQVTWPSGTVQTVSDAKSGTTLQITEPQ